MPRAEAPLTTAPSPRQGNVREAAAGGEGAAAAPGAGEAGPPPPGVPAVRQRLPLRPQLCRGRTAAAPSPRGSAEFTYPYLLRRSTATPPHATAAAIFPLRRRRVLCCVRRVRAGDRPGAGPAGGGAGPVRLRGQRGRPGGSRYLTAMPCVRTGWLLREHAESRHESEAVPQRGMLYVAGAVLWGCFEATGLSLRGCGVETGPFLRGHMMWG